MTLAARSAPWLVLTLATLLLGSGCRAVTSIHEGALFEYDRVVMGAPCTLKLYAQSQADADAAARAAFARLAEIEEALSDWMPKSEVSQLPQVADERVRVSFDLFDVLNRSWDMHQLTDGAFDPTVGPLVQLWRTARQTGVAPTDAEIAAARACVGFQHVQLTAPPRSYMADIPGVRLDFGGIGQGFGAAEALKTLDNHGAPRALVDLSGDVAASGPPPGTEGWRVRIEATDEIVLLHDAGITTSGDEFQHFDVTNAEGTLTRYSHIIDPRTGMPVANAPTITVWDPDPVVADALATALTVIPRKEWEVVLARFPNARVFTAARPAAGTAAADRLRTPSTASDRE